MDRDELMPHLTAVQNVMRSLFDELHALKQTSVEAKKEIPSVFFSWLRTQVDANLSLLSEGHCGKRKAPDGDVEENPWKVPRLDHQVAQEDQDPKDQVAQMLKAQEPKGQVAQEPKDQVDQMLKSQVDQVAQDPKGQEDQVAQEPKGQEDQVAQDPKVSNKELDWDLDWDLVKPSQSDVCDQSKSVSDWLGELSNGPFHFDMPAYYGYTCESCECMLNSEFSDCRLQRLVACDQCEVPKVWHMGCLMRRLESDYDSLRKWVCPCCEQTSRGNCWLWNVSRACEAAMFPKSFDLCMQIVQS